MVNTGALWPGPAEAESRVLAMQTKLHQWAMVELDRRFDGVSIWRAGCGESRTSGSEGGPEKFIVRKTTGRSGPTTWGPRTANGDPALRRVNSDCAHSID